MPKYKEWLSCVNPEGGQGKLLGRLPEKLPGAADAAREVVAQ